jgi:uncharacterized membrane protein
MEKRTQILIGIGMLIFLIIAFAVKFSDNDDGELNDYEKSVTIEEQGLTYDNEEFNEIIIDSQLGDSFFPILSVGITLCIITIIITLVLSKFNNVFRTGGII